MIRLRHKLLLHAFRTFDQLMLFGTLIFIYIIFRENWHFDRLFDIADYSYSATKLAGLMLLALAWFVIFNTQVRYDANRFSTLRSQLQDVAKATTLAAGLLFLIVAIVGFAHWTPQMILIFWCATTALGIISRVSIRSLLAMFRRSGLNSRHLLIVGAGARATDLAQRIESNPELGYRIVGFMADVSENRVTAGDRQWPVIGPLGNLQEYLKKGIVDEVMICLPVKEQFREIYEIIELCRDLGVVVRLGPQVSDVNVLARAQIELFEGDYIVTFFREDLLWQLLIKRFMDVTVSSILLVVLAPFLIAVAIAIKVTMPGPVFFVQERMGMNKRKFRLLKFRSMVVNAEAQKAALAKLNEMDGPVFKIKNDPRITPLGRWLRKLSIDEFPQLINILKGEMSLVGPRPPLPKEVDQYEWLSRKRLSIKPGLTCLWQISGRNEVSFQQWMAMDRQYIENWSIWLDLRILAKTVPVVLFGKGAS